MLEINFCTRSLPINRIAGNLAAKNPSFTWHLSALLLLCGFWPLGAVFRAPLLAIFHTRCIERAANHVIANAREDPSHGLRARARSSAPANYGQCRECTSSLPRCSSTARAPLCAVLSSASSASGCTRERKRRAFPDSLPAPATSSSSGSSPVRNALIVQTSARSTPSLLENSASLFCACDNTNSPRRATHVNEQKRSPTHPKVIQVLRADASPRGVNCICLIRRGCTALRGWRPIPAALPRPVPPFSVPGLEDFPFTTGP